jgi:hypothetical protein
MDREAKLENSKFIMIVFATDKEEVNHTKMVNLILSSLNIKAPKIQTLNIRHQVFKIPQKPLPAGGYFDLFCTVVQLKPQKTILCDRTGYQCRVKTVFFGNKSSNYSRGKMTSKTDKSRVRC